MAKKTKAPKVPDIYQGLTTDKQGTQLCLVVDKHGGLFKFDNSSVVSITSEGIQYKFANFEAFSSWADNNHADFCRIHNSVFRANVPEDTDRVYAHVYAWKKMIATAADRTSGAGNPANAGKTTEGNQGRKMTILTRLYFLGPKGRDVGEISAIKTPQAKACFRILSEVLDADKKERETAPDADKDEVIVPCVTEEKLRRIIYERQSELHTRQDPWRIFQYYRPTLLASHLIKHD